MSIHKISKQEVETSPEITTPFTWSQIGPRSSEDALAVAGEAERILRTPEGKTYIDAAIFELSSDWMQRHIYTRRKLAAKQQELADVEAQARARIESMQARFKCNVDTVEGSLQFFGNVLELQVKPSIKAIADGKPQGKCEYQIFNSSAGCMGGTHRLRSNHLLPSTKDVEGFVKWMQNSDTECRAAAIDLSVAGVSFIAVAKDGVENYAKLATRFHLPETISWEDRHFMTGEELVFRPFPGKLYNCELLPGVRLMSGAGLVVVPLTTPDSKWITTPDKLELAPDQVTLPKSSAELTTLLADCKAVNPQTRMRVIKSFIEQ